MATSPKQRGPATAPEALSPQRKWKAITLATLLLVPAYWLLLAGLVSAAAEERNGPDPGGALALGIAVVPFMFVVLAVMTGQRNIGSSVLKAMGMSLLVGLPVAALAGDVATGIVAGVGAGGIVAIRADLDHSTRSRAAAVGIAVVYTYVLVHTVSALALLPAPVFPLTAIGLADHWSERRRDRDARG